MVTASTQVGANQPCPLIQKVRNLSEKEETSMKVIIVGAGIAGMSVGGLLAKAGADVTIIEQENRIMGRAGTIRGEEINKSKWLAWQKRQSTVHLSRNVSGMGRL
jgi:monoamine oxidase